MGLPAFFKTPGIPRSWHISSIRIAQLRFNRETAVGSQKSTQALGAPRTIKKCLITPKVTTNFLISPCTPIPYASFLRPTAVSRFNLKTAVGSRKSAQPLDAPRKLKNRLITQKVTTQFLHFLCTSMACTAFSRPTAAFRFKKTLH